MLAGADRGAYHRLSAFESLYADEVISEKEGAVLDRLRIKLAILPGEAIAVERDVRGERTAAVAA